MKQRKDTIIKVLVVFILLLFVLSIIIPTIMWIMNSLWMY